MNWLFLRGLTRESRHWGSFPEAFESGLPRHRVHHLDLPGVGTENGRACPPTITDMADDLRRRFVPLKAQVDGPWSILAISLGGMIALDWAARFPLDFDQVVVINTSAGNLSRPWERMLFKNLPRVARSAMSRNLHLRENTVLDLTINRPPPSPDALVEGWIDIARAAPVRRRTLVRQLTAATRSRIPENLETPGLVLTSRADRLVHWHCSRKIAEHLDLPLRVHEEAGHDLPHDAPDWVVQQVVEWLNEP
jgi:pimeloyl-ACP methyl ester carboxylesterase